MRTSAVTRKTVAILVGAAIVPVTPAIAQDGPNAAPDRAGTPVKRADDDQTVLRRNGDRAVPFDPVVGAGNQLALRRDGAKAEPFAAEAGPPTSFAGESFDWGDAMIGAGAAYALMLLGAGALTLIRRRRPGRHLAQRTA